MATNAPRSLQIYDPILTRIARRYKSKGFIARSILPTIPVSKLSGQYPVFPRSYWFQNDVDNLVRDRAGTKEVDFEWSTETYLCEERALKVGWTDLEADQADASLRFERNKTEFLTHRMELAYEVQVANLLLPVSDGGEITEARKSTPSVNWDQDTATIEADIKLGVLDVYDAIGQAPSHIVIPYKVAYAMAVQEDIRAILSNQISGGSNNFIELGSRVLPSVIHGMKVLIPQGSQIDSNREGASAESISEIWGDEVRLLKLDASASWGEPSVAYRLEHTPKKVTRYRTVDPDVNYVREMERYDLKVVAPDAAHIIRNVLS